MNQLILLAIDGAIATVTLNRADKLNAFNMAMLGELESACQRIDTDDAVRVVIVQSASPKAFCAGADIIEWAPLGGRGMWARWIRDGQRVFDRVARLRQPTIAAIGGIAYGGGLELALSCDMRIAATGARLGLPETTIGAIPGWTGSQRLPRLVGTGRAKQMIFSGQPIEAVLANEWGLVNEVVPSEQLGNRVLELARRIADNAPVAVQAAKQLVDASAGEGVTTTLEALAAGLTASTADAEEGIEAFRGRRPPKFSGR